MPALWSILLDCGEEHARAVGEKLAPLVRATDRFTMFMTNYEPDPPSERKNGDAGQIQWADLSQHFLTIYGYRSRALHDGTPFPAPMCEPPVRWSGNGYAEKPPWLWSQAGSSTWLAGDIPMHLHMFEYLARHALLNWWRSFTPDGPGQN